MSPIYLVKPVTWNDAGYVAPAGSGAASGFVSEYGFGGEEWNNSPSQLFEERGVIYRAFHVEGLGRFDDPTYDGELNIFQMASRHSKQVIVAVATHATSVRNRPLDARSIAKKIRSEGRWKDVWRLERVREIWEDDRAAFLREWKQGSMSLPSYFCKEEDYFTLPEPATVEASIITGKRKLASMHSRFQVLDLRQAELLYHQISRYIDKDLRNTIADRLGIGLLTPIEQDAQEDVRDIERRNDLDETTRRHLIEARRCQGKFRTDLDRVWEARCVLTGVTCRAVLRASHIKPWALASDDERRDPFNGLLLSANLDALFDRALISFDPDGSLLVSRSISGTDRAALGLVGPITLQLPASTHEYMKHHRSRFEG